MVGATEQDERYTVAAAEFGAALERLARAYEADPDQRNDLMQDIQLGIWRSFAVFDGRCSVRTWVYRVAHNVAARHVLRRRRSRPLASLAELAAVVGDDDPERTVGDRQVLDRLFAVIRQMRPPDGQVMLLYLEGLDSAAIGDVTGLSPGAVSTRVHRIKTLLARRFQHGGVQ